MNELIKSYLDYLKIELNYSDNTIRNYKIDILNFNEFLKSKNINFFYLSRNDVRIYLKFLDLNKYDSKTISRKITSLRMFYNFLMDLGKIKVNIFDNISNPKVSKKIPNYLNYEEIDLLLNSFDVSEDLGFRNKLIFELIYSSGLRISEASSVLIKNLYKDDNKLKVMGKGNKERYVYFGNVLKKDLNDYLQNHRNNILNGKYSEYLFVTKLGNKISTRMIDKILRNLMKELCFKNKISAHTLRHTFATHLLNNGADIKSVQELLGHTSLSTTQIYTHVSTDRIKSVYLRTHPRESLNE